MVTVTWRSGRCLRLPRAGLVELEDLGDAPEAEVPGAADAQVEDLGIVEVGPESGEEIVVDGEVVDGEAARELEGDLFGLREAGPVGFVDALVVLFGDAVRRRRRRSPRQSYGAGVDPGDAHADELAEPDRQDAGLVHAPGQGRCSLAHVGA